MIPSTNAILSVDLKVERQPSKNYKFHIERDTINGFCDGLDAMKQVVYKILSTERFEYIIYSWNYGIELRDLFGEPFTYVCPELKRRITEALVQDDRIDNVDNFEFDLSTRGTVKVSFIVHTIFGEFEAEKAVNF